MSKLGERVRKLRKEKKMTLVDVAGNEMSKGMLSLIENGRSNPSMESLQHIAKQLGVNVQVLLAEESSEAMKRSLIELEDDLQKLHNSSSMKEYKRISSLIKEKLITVFNEDLPKTYETGRFYEIAGRIHYGDKEYEIGSTYLEKAIAYYESLSLFHSVYKAQLRTVLNTFVTHNYQMALEELLSFKQEYKSRELLSDPLVQIESDYLEALLLFSVGRYEEGSSMLEQVIAFSKRNNIYYLMDDIYRIASFSALLNGDDEKRRYTLMKSRQFAEFTERADGLESCMYLEVHYENVYLNNHDKALEMIESIRCDKNFGAIEENGHWNLELARAYYGLGKIDLAYEELERFVFPEYAHHPFDRAMLSTADAYMALCLIKREDIKTALVHAEKAKLAVADLPHTPYHQFIRETWEKTFNLAREQS
ncbi:helix-turn-helix domain-containing protein [Sutcliffiella deserti]|uniref:helix-turn-helix domain-containing protein n=1 Tax=Sutcliffiella deserti TaxID=2875501 RepID=UPI001CBAB0E7|nr:helix-turn-helix transcriptional regulator [Sutcliffiella deserti]